MELEEAQHGQALALRLEASGGECIRMYVRLDRFFFYC